MWQNTWETSPPPPPVEWKNYSNGIIIDKEADQSDMVSLIFVGKTCVCVSRPIQRVSFPQEHGVLPKWLVDFLWVTDTFRKTNGNRRGFR